MIVVECIPGRDPTTRGIVDANEQEHHTEVNSNVINLGAKVMRSSMHPSGRSAEGRALR